MKQKNTDDLQQELMSSFNLNDFLSDNQVYFSNESTLYTKTGDIIFPIFALAVIIWYLVLLIASFNQKKNVP